MNFILTRDKDVTIPPAALKLGGLPDDAKLEMTTLDGAVIVAKSKMTAMSISSCSPRSRPTSPS